MGLDEEESSVEGLEQEAEEEEVVFERVESLICRLSAQSERLREELDELRDLVVERDKVG